MILAGCCRVAVLTYCGNGSLQAPPRLRPPKGVEMLCKDCHQPTHHGLCSNPACPNVADITDHLRAQERAEHEMIRADMMRDERRGK